VADATTWVENVLLGASGKDTRTRLTPAAGMITWPASFTEPTPCETMVVTWLSGFSTRLSWSSTTRAIEAAPELFNV
jgi:hypothetical protein